MALNVSESNAVNTLLEWLFDQEGVDGLPIPNNAARDAAVLLTASASKTLAAGLTPERTARLWRNALHKKELQ